MDEGKTFGHGVHEIQWVVVSHLWVPLNYGRERYHDLSKGSPSSIPIPKGDPLTRVQCQLPR
jgi:hypothetical protein